MDCPTCGIPVHVHAVICQKCETSLKDQYVDRISVVDVAHNGEDWRSAKHKILEAVNDALANGLKGTKIIHGRGAAKGHSSIIKNKSVRFLKMLSLRFKARLTKDRNNDGAHILYFNS